MNDPTTPRNQLPTIPHTFSTGLHTAVAEALRDAGINPLTYRSTTLIEGLDTTGARFVRAITDAEGVEIGRAIRSELVALFTPTVPS